MDYNISYETLIFAVQKLLSNMVSIKTQVSGLADNVKSLQAAGSSTTQMTREMVTGRPDVIQQWPIELMSAFLDQEKALEDDSTFNTLVGKLHIETLMSD
jgi:hypothetical protein